MVVPAMKPAAKGARIIVRTTAPTAWVSEKFCAALRRAASGAIAPSSVTPGPKAGPARSGSIASASEDCSSIRSPGLNWPATVLK
jgi:hypothetical protein